MRHNSLIAFRPGRIEVLWMEKGFDSMTTLLAVPNATAKTGMRPARIYVGAWGLVFDAVRGVWRDPQEFLDSVEQRGIRVEQVLNRQLGRVGYDLGSLTDVFTRRLSHYLRGLQNQLAQTGQLAEDEIEKQVERTLERLGIPNRERIEKLTHEIETLNAKIDLELARYAESEKTA
jgi:hypothetical protein